MKFNHEILKELRIDRNLTQKELADNIGYSKAVIGFWENGTHQPTAESIIALANFFQVSTDYLLGLEIPTRSSGEILSAVERELVSLFRRLPEIRQQTVIDSTRFMVDANNQSAYNSKK